MTDDKERSEKDGTDKDEPEVKEIDCLEAIGHLYAYLDGELDRVEKFQVEQHLEHCKSCYSRAQLEGAINERLTNFHKDEAPDSLQDRLRDLVDKL
jgi:anti-sigma factor (TIGR02949 family)